MWQALIPAAASIIGGLIGKRGQEETNESNAQQAALNREFQGEQAELNRAFQERMSNSAYQRATEDMQKAGLNPMLAYSQGGASQPSGSGVSGAQAVMGNSAAQLAQNVSNLALTTAQVEKTEAEADLVRAQENQTTASAGEVQYRVQSIVNGIREQNARIENIASDTTNNEKRNQLMEAQRLLANAQRNLTGQHQNESEAREALDKALKILREQDVRINAPLEKFAGTDVGEHSPAIRMLFDLIKSGVLLRGR